MESREAMERFERAEELAEEREGFARHAAIIVAILAALLAITALQVERQSERVLLAQAQASDAYNELEANSLKKHTDGDTAQLLTLLAPGNPAAASLAASLQKAVNTKYAPNETSLLTKATGLEKTRDDAEKHHNMFQLAEGAFQLAIVLISISIVARAVVMLRAAEAIGIVGLLLLLNGFVLLIPFG